MTAQHSTRFVLGPRARWLILRAWRRWRTRATACSASCAASSACAAATRCRTALRRAAGGVNFSVFSRHASEMSLVLFVPGDPEPVLEMPLDPRYNKTGDVWHVLVCGLDPGVEYGFRASGRRPTRGRSPDRFDPPPSPDRPLLRSRGRPRALGQGHAPAARAASDAPLARHRRGVRLGPRAPAASRSPTRSSTSCTCAASRATRPPASRTPAPTSACREDPVPEGARRHRGRADAGARVRRVRLPRTEPARPASRSGTSGATAPSPSSRRRRRTRGRRHGEVREFKRMVKAFHAAGHRGDPRRRLQPHRRGRRARPPPAASAGSTTRPTTCSTRDRELPRTSPAAATRSTATTRSCAT